MTTRIEDNNSGLVLHDVPTYVRPAYTALVGSLTVESLSDKLETAAEQIGLLLDEAGFQAGKFDPRLQISLARYALLGDWQGILPSAGQSKSLFEQWGKTELLISMISQFTEIHSGESPEYPVELLLMLNMLRPRVQIDLARLGEGDVFSVSLIEVSLLAGMAERSVRNAASPSYPQRLITTQASAGTSVEPLVAHEWLLGRRRYHPTELPTNEPDRSRLVQHLRSFDL